MQTSPPETRVDDALQYLIGYLNNPPTGAREFGTYGYDIYLTIVAHYYLVEHKGGSPNINSNMREVEKVSPLFFDAAWILCRRGILRPSINHCGKQAIEGGVCYSITEAGRDWLRKYQQEIFIPTEPARFATFIGQFREQLGDGFYQRSQEALTCYSFGAYLACCSMAGAATESILLKLAVAKAGNDEAKVLAAYKRAGGRNLVERQIASGLEKRLSDPFYELTTLIKYWRDEAAHGELSEISEFEAYEALARLLRFAHFATEHFDILTKPTS